MGEGDVGGTRATENAVVPTKNGMRKAAAKGCGGPSAKMRVFTPPFSPPCKNMPALSLLGSLRAGQMSW